MTTKKKPHNVVLGVECLEDRRLLAAAAATILTSENFDGTLAGRMPKGWSEWSNPGSFGGVSNRGTAGSTGLASDGISIRNARSWYNIAQPADVRASANLYLDGSRLVPGEVFIRGSAIDSSSPSFYAVTATRGMKLELVRVVNGQRTVLTTLTSAVSRYITNQWVRITLEGRGANLSVQVQRLDTNEFLASNGQWQNTATPAIRYTDARSNANPSAITSGGMVGLGRPAGFAGQVVFDDFSATNLATNATVNQTFNNTASGQIPADWSQWSDEGVFVVSTGRSVSATNGLTGLGANRAVGRAWADVPAPVNSSASVNVFLNSLAEASLFIRGQNLSSSAPTYYAANVTRGLTVTLTRTVNGRTHTIGRSVQSIPSRYISNQWVRLTLTGEDNRISVMVQRLDTGEYLTASGGWQGAETSAITVNDSVTLQAGLAGVARGNGAGDNLVFDDFQVTAPAAPQALTVSFQTPAGNAVIKSSTTAQLVVNSTSPITSVAYYVDGVRQTASSPTALSFVIDPNKYNDGPHNLTAVVYNSQGNVGRSTVYFTTNKASSSVAGVNIPQHYSHIRIAQLAYSGTPIGEFEKELLRNSVDLVVANESYLNEIKAVAPDTPKLIYTNVSSVYRDLLTDWLNYADSKGVSREGAFFHASTPTKFSGNSAGSMPVNWFWSVQRGGLTPNFEDLTPAARNRQIGVEFGNEGSSVYLGYPDKFREINVSLSRGAAQGWSSVIEYPTAVNADGEPIAWRALRLVSDTSVGVTRSGQILFDPSANPGWVTARIGNNGARLFYVRIRTVRSGWTPIAYTLMGRDFVNAKGTTTGTIPVFDRSADLNNDGYLTDAEYANRKPGMDARFFYESRVFQPPYGQMRFATVPSYQPFRDWAVDYHQRMLGRQPLADGLFVDNSHGKPLVDETKVLESVANFAENYGSLLAAIDRGIGNKFLLPNTSGGGITADPIIRQNTGSFEEFAIRALAHHYRQFEDLALLLQHRSTLRTTPPYTVLDSLPTNGSPTDPRTQIATLAYYYLLQDPKTTFLDFFGGFEPSTTWERHWTPAAAYNVGQPTGGWSMLATGADPGNRNLTYRVYQRSYTNALVLYKPLSYSSALQQTGTIENNTATVHQLGGTFRPLLANGTLGAPVTSVTLRNGEGAIMIRV